MLNTRFFTGSIIRTSKEGKALNKACIRIKTYWVIMSWDIKGIYVFYSIKPYLLTWLFFAGIVLFLHILLQGDPHPLAGLPFPRLAGRGSDGRRNELNHDSGPAQRRDAEEGHQGGVPVGGTRLEMRTERGIDRETSLSAR
jgi:hypothetical protein